MSGTTQPIQVKILNDAQSGNIAGVLADLNSIPASLVPSVASSQQFVAAALDLSETPASAPLTAVFKVLTTQPYASSLGGQTDAFLLYNAVNSGNNAVALQYATSSGITPQIAATMGGSTLDGAMVSAAAQPESQQNTNLIGSLTTKFATVTGGAALSQIFYTLVANNNVAAATAFVKSPGLNASEGTLPSMGGSTLDEAYASLGNLNTLTNKVAVDALIGEATKEFVPFVSGQAVAQLLYSVSGDATAIQNIANSPSVTPFVAASAGGSTLDAVLPNLVAQPNPGVPAIEAVMRTFGQYIGGQSIAQALDTATSNHQYAVDDAIVKNISPGQAPQVGGSTLDEAFVNLANAPSGLISDFTITFGSLVSQPALNAAVSSSQNSGDILKNLQPDAFQRTAFALTTGQVQPNFSNAVQLTTGTTFSIKNGLEAVATPQNGPGSLNLGNGSLVDISGNLTAPLKVFFDNAASLTTDHVGMGELLVSTATRTAIFDPNAANVSTQNVAGGVLATFTPSAVTPTVAPSEHTFG